MANREACELYIEQEIKDALSEGKKPYSIGKELSAWVERLFEVNISPETLKTRAYRQQKISSNEPKQSQPPETIEYSEPEIFKDRHPQGGGRREGAGRPSRQEPPEARLNPSLISNAMAYVGFAVSQIERIPKDDPEIFTAIDYFINWLNDYKQKIRKD